MRARSFGFSVLALTWPAVACLDTDSGSARVHADAVLAAPCDRDPFGLWPFPAGPRPERLALAPDGDAFVVAGSELVRLDADGGCIVWRQTLPVVARDVAAIGNDVVIARPDGVERLHGSSGASSWVRPLDEGALAITAGSAGIAAASIGGEIVLMDPEGTVLWRVHQPLEVAHGDAVGDVAMRPDGDLFVARVLDGCVGVVRLRASDGGVVWQRGFGPTALAPPRLARGSRGDVFVSASRVGDIARQHVMLLSGDDGQTLWEVDAPSAQVPETGPDSMALAEAAGDLIAGGTAVEEPSADAPANLPAPGLDGLLVRFAAHMPVVWTIERLGGDGPQYVTDVAGEEETGVHWVIGWYAHEVSLMSFDTGFGEELSLTSPTGGGFVARRPPGIGY